MQNYLFSLLKEVIFTLTFLAQLIKATIGPILCYFAEAFNNFDISRLCLASHSLYLFFLLIVFCIFPDCVWLPTASICICTWFSVTCISNLFQTVPVFSNCILYFSRLCLASHSCPVVYRASISTLSSGDWS